MVALSNSEGQTAGGTRERQQRRALATTPEGAGRAGVTKKADNFKGLNRDERDDLRRSATGACVSGRGRGGRGRGRCWWPGGRTAGAAGSGGRRGGSWGRGSANAPGTELQQLRADVQALRESCDQLVPRLQEVAAVCDTLQVKNAEHETLWAAIAPKLVRLDVLLDTHANAPLGGQSGISGQTESVGQKQPKGFLRYGQRITCAGGTQSPALCLKYQNTVSSR